MGRYNIMTSKNADSSNALSRDVQKLPITMLIDFFRATMEQWWCQRRDVGAKTKKDITEYVEKVIDIRINKSFGFQVYQIDQSRYEVTRKMKMYSQHGISLLHKFLGMHCSNVIVVFKELRYQHCSTWVSSYFTMETYRSTCIELVFTVPVLTEYKESDEVMAVLPLLMDKLSHLRPTA
uniref:Uncharacterized protein n=1 Tax=Lactuca sativa TaxID=4236 RepID=A0A9R1VJC7_LACSA|nr:hypothetical protein LSAT_V11C500286000 [Lactuca sativa]